MINCKYTLIVDGQEKVFRSELELDTFLRSTHFKEIQEVQNGKRIFQTMTPQEIALSKLDEASKDIGKVDAIFQQMDDSGDYEKLTNIVHSLGVSRFIELLGLRTTDVTTPFNIENWRKDTKIKLLAQEISNSDADLIIEKTEQSWNKIQGIGSEIHNYFESLIKGIEFTPKLLSEIDLAKVRLMHKEITDEIKKKHGDDAIIRSEVAFKTTKLAIDKKKLLEKDDINSINGRLDLLVIDSSGQAHMYDYKISPKRVGDWSLMDNEIINSKNTWASTKKESINFQMAIYGAILQQYGIRVRSANIIPIQIELQKAPDNIEIIGINNIEKVDTINISGYSLTGKKANLISEFIPSLLTEEEASKTMTLASERFKEIFPENSRDFAIQQRQADFDYIKGHGNTGDNQGYWGIVNKEGFDAKFYLKEKAFDGKTVYAKTMDELDEKIRDYVVRVNQTRASAMTTIADEIYEATWDKSKLPLLGSGMNEDSKLYLSNQFRKYITNNWTFEKNDELNQYGIFLFYKNGRSELVVLTQTPIDTKYNLGLGNSILGKTTSDKDADTKHVLPATHGAMMLMKAMCVIDANPDIFKNKPIASIKVVNPWNTQTIRATNTMMKYNWNQLMEANKIPSKSLELIFRDDIEAMTNEIFEIAETLPVDINDFIVAIDDNSRENIREQLSHMLNLLRKQFPILLQQDKYIPGDPTWELFRNILLTIASIDGYSVLDETDKPLWLGTKNTGGFVGLMFSSSQTSSSANIRVLGDLISEYNADVRRKYEDVTSPVIMAIEAFYKESGASKIIGGEANLFLSWFDDIDTLTLKDPDSAEFNGSPAARKALRMILDTMAKLRHGDNEVAIEQSKQPGGTYYQLPLLEAKFSRQSKRLGMWNAIKNKLKMYWNPVEDIFVGQAQQKRDYERTHGKLFNRFNIQGVKRTKFIEDHGSGFFETDVERVFLEAARGFVKTNVSKKYLGNIAAMQLTLRHMEVIEGANLKNINDVFDKTVKNKIYGEPIIEGNMLKWYQVTSIVKTLFSKMSLGINPRAFFREIFQGTFMNASRAMVEKIPGIDAKHYAEASKFVIQHCAENLKSGTLMRKLGFLYGMANMSLNELAEQHRINWTGFKNLSSSSMFLTSTMPDYLHRTTLLVAKMMADGSLEAHSVDDNGNLIYDWKKDRRFSVYANGDTSNKQYLHQKTVYLANIAEWNSKHPEQILKEGDDLLQAYTNREASSIKNWGDTLFGHYDAESKALVNSTFLGSAMMQYRTFLTARAEQWALNPGVYNMEFFKQQYDKETGEELWEVLDEDPNTHEIIHSIIKESDVTQEMIDKQLTKPYKKWEGEPMEGMAYSMIKWLSAFKDLKRFKLLWEDPFERKLLILWLWELGIMSGIMALIKMLYNTNEVDIKESTWATQWSYNVLYGAAQDGPVWNVFGSVFSDFNPPVAGSIKRFTNTAVNMITDSENIGDVLVESMNQFGALREVSNAIKAVN